MKHCKFLILLGAVTLATGCERQSASSPQLAGQHAMEYYGCASCHEVPGIPGAQGQIGPSLKHFAGRNFIGGILRNSPDNLARWIEDAPSIDPRTAMPHLKIPEKQARQIVSYLYTLQ